MTRNSTTSKHRSMGWGKVRRIGPVLLGGCVAVGLRLHRPAGAMEMNLAKKKKKIIMAMQALYTRSRTLIRNLNLTSIWRRVTS